MGDKLKEKFWMLGSGGSVMLCHMVWVQRTLLTVPSHQSLAITVKIVPKEYYLMAACKNHIIFQILFEWWFNSVFHRFWPRPVIMLRHNHVSNVCFVFFFSFPLPDAMWTAKYHEWHGSIVPPFYSQETRSGLWILASSSWKTQQSQSTASRSKMLMSMTRGHMFAPSLQTRNQNPQKCTSLFKVRWWWLLSPVDDWIKL